MKLFAALLLLLSLLAGCGRDEPLCSDCNILLISLDALRADHLGLYGYHRPTSPRLEELAADAVVFDAFLNNGGATLKSHKSMMTSLRPGVHTQWPVKSRVLDTAHRTLAEHLRKAGYTTAGFVDRAWLVSEMGFSQGFDLYDDAGGRFRTILPKVNEWLRTNGDRKFFLFLHSFDIHAQGGQLPYDCPGEYPTLYSSSYDVDFDGCGEAGCSALLLRTWNEEILRGRAKVSDFLSPQELGFMEALYDGCINYSDDQLGRLFDEMRRLNLYDNTLIVVTSDHGENFGHHGIFLHDNANLGYESTAWIPLLIKFPDSRFGGRRVSHLGAMIDLLPTLLEAAGLPPEPRAQGRSLLPTVREDLSVRDAVLIGRGLRTAGWKFLEERQELFRLASDPGETRNLYDSEPRQVERLRRQFLKLKNEDEVWIEQRSDEAQASVSPDDLSDEDIRQLRALGYLE